MTNKELKEQIEMALKATNLKDDYSVGMRNGFRWVLTCITGEAPKYEATKNKSFIDKILTRFIADKRPINRQEPPLKIKTGHVDEYYGDFARCPSCDSSWIMGDDEVLHYCPSCGKAVEWE